MNLNHNKSQNKIINRINILLIIFTSIMLLLFFGCSKSTAPDYVDPNLHELEVSSMIYDKCYSLIDIDVLVYISYYYITMLGCSPLEIETCFLYVDDENVELRSSIPNLFAGSLTLQPGKNYNIKLVINDHLYETDFLMPTQASVKKPNQPFIRGQKYSFSWELEQSYDVQLVRIILDRNDVDEPTYSYYLAEIEPDDRSYSFIAPNYHKRYIFRGVSVRGINYTVKDRIRYVAETANGYII